MFIYRGHSHVSRTPLPHSAPSREIWAYGDLTMRTLLWQGCWASWDYGHSPSVNRCTQPRKLPGQDMGEWGQVRAANPEAPQRCPLVAVCLPLPQSKREQSSSAPTCSQLVTRAALQPARHTSACWGESLKGKSIICSQICPQAEWGLRSGGRRVGSSRCSY